MIGTLLWFLLGLAAAVGAWVKWIAADYTATLICSVVVVACAVVIKKRHPE